MHGVVPKTSLHIIKDDNKYILLIFTYKHQNNY